MPGYQDLERVVEESPARHFPRTEYMTSRRAKFFGVLILPNKAIKPTICDRTQILKKTHLKQVRRDNQLVGITRKINITPYNTVVSPAPLSLHMYFLILCNRV